MPIVSTTRFNAAIKAGGLHFLLSLLAAALAAALVFGLWYPFPYRELMGGRDLFFIVIAVDVVCGPLLTMVLYTPNKPKKELVRDLGLVAIIQLAALFYGLNVVMQVRPVYLVFEVDRFNAVSAVDIDEDELAKAPSPWNVLPLWGPKVIATRKAKDQVEQLTSLEASLIGREPSVRPDWWQPFEKSRADVILYAKPLSALRKLRADEPDVESKISATILQSGKTEENLRWLPLTSKRSTDWVVFVDRHTGDPLAYAHLDGF